MKFTTKMLININPSYLNHVKEDELNDEIIMYALEKGYDFNNDKLDRYCKYDCYVNYNFNKDRSFLYFFVNSKHFSLNNLSDEIINYMKKDSNLLITCIEKDISFIKVLDNELTFTDNELDNLFRILDYKNINYSELNESFLVNNYKLGLKYLNKDFSNIVNFKKYNLNYMEFKDNIMEIFFDNLKDNIVFLNEISEFNIGIDLQEKIVDVLKNNSILVDEKTPKFIYENKYVVYNLIMSDLDNSKFIDREVGFYGDQINSIINKIRDEKFVFDSIPKCFQDIYEIKKEIVNNNPYIIDSKDFKLFNGIYNFTLDLILNDKYKINNNSNKDIMSMLCQEYLDIILEKDFESLKYFEKLDVRFNGNQEKLYSVLKKNDYVISNTIPLCLQNNDILIKEGLEKGILDINKLDLGNARYSDDFKLYLVNYAINNNIENDDINSYKESIINQRSIVIDNCLYIKNLNEINDLNLPLDIKEIFVSNNDINNINEVVDKVKESNNSIEKIVVDLKMNNFTAEELESIKDKNLVEFGSVKDKTRLSVDKMIEIEHILDLMVKDINESDLSPYERYIAVYSIVKKFKEYKFYEDNKDIDRKYDDQSRNIYLIMENDYIVCVGYANLLESLLKRVGINSATWSVVSNKEGHMRNYVNIVDSKYNINGYYMCDPTWDSIKYDHLSADKYDYLHEIRDKSRNSFDITKDENGKALLSDEMFNDYTDLEMLEYLKGKKNYEYFKEQISKLDPDFFETIKDKEVDLELASKVNEHFKNKINKPIDKGIEAKAKFELNEYIFGKSKTEEERDKKWNDYVISNNYSCDLLTKDYNSDINKFYEVIKNKSFKEYNELYDLSGAYDKACINEAYLKLKQDYLTNEGDISFGLYYFNARNKEKLIFSISIDNTLFNSDKMEYVLSTLKEKGYDVINEKNDRFVIMLDNSYIDKSFIELYQIANLIKQDYMEIYESIFVKENNKLGV